MSPSPSRVCSALIAACAVAAAVHAQGFRWNLPGRGAAVFERTSTRVVVRPIAHDRARGVRHVVRPAGEGGHLWRYRQYAAGVAADGWQRPAFDDSEWSEGWSAFRDKRGRTRWNQRFLDARTRFDAGRRVPRTVVLTIDHDDAARVWLNELLVYEHRSPGRRHRVLDQKATEAIVPGDNVLAVHVENTGGAARFDLSLSLLEKSYGDAEQAVNYATAASGQAAQVRRELFVPWRAPAVLCQGQLDERQQAIALPPVDIRDLPAFVSLDTTRAAVARSIAMVLPRTWRLGDLHVKGRVASPDAAGRQRLALTVESREPDRHGDSGRWFAAHVLPQFQLELDGTLRIERQLDFDNGLVRGFTAWLDGELQRRSGDAHRLELSIEEHYKLKEVRQNRDSRFTLAVHAAIENGVAKLRKEIADPDKRSLRNQPSGDRSYNSGRLALALLAMVHGEVPRDDPILVEGFEELAQRRLVDTYSLAHAIMAVEARYRPLGEHEDLRAGLIQAPRKRQPSDADRELLELWTAQLLQNVDRRVDPGYLLRFNYVPGNRYDHSVNQYGLLGLYSAHLCGIEVPATVWEGAANHLIDDQEKPEQRTKLQLTSHRQWQDEARSGTTTREIRKPVRVAGWGYHGPKHNGVPQPIYGSMTCAGIAGLTICQAGLRDLGVARHAVMTRADAAVRSGFAWLAENFTVHWHPGRLSHTYHHLYYYLYGLERACELAGVAMINDRDWYYEGAMALLDQQRSDGGWPADARGGEILERTAFAVLFLKKATAPVYTQAR